MELHGLDTEREVFFYEQDFYVLSNFSAFAIRWNGLAFPTSEHAYQWAKFGTQPQDESAREWAIREPFANAVLHATSAHEAFKNAEKYREHRRPDWGAVKVGIMRDILRAKVSQHEYVRRKLLATGDRTLIENSWRDDFWGWGPNHDGQNMLGRLWIEVRTELRAQELPQGAVAFGASAMIEEEPTLGEEWVRDDEALVWVFTIVCDRELTLGTVQTWTDQQCREAEEWAWALHFCASDNPHIEVPPMPTHVQALPIALA